MCCTSWCVASHSSVVGGTFVSTPGTLESRVESVAGTASFRYSKAAADCAGPVTSAGITTRLGVSTGAEGCVLTYQATAAPAPRTATTPAVTQPSPARRGATPDS